ncbi:MAG: hypothetical protein DMG60_18880 [Acidobacteria bacterium]|nr:MAG: hypothetical protein DMG60_18880 [Acidobacteriota bacterium]
MDSKFIDFLKQDVAKWQEAATAVDELLSHLPEADQKIWSGRAAYYRNNAKLMRDLVEQIVQGTLGFSTVLALSQIVSSCWL